MLRLTETQLVISAIMSRAAAPVILGFVEELFSVRSAIALELDVAIVPLPSPSGEASEDHHAVVGRHVLSAAAGTPGPWVAAAACVGEPDRLFFPERGDSMAAAKAICASCPVRTECLDFALATDQAFGIWGGTSARERTRIRRARRRAAA